MSLDLFSENVLDYYRNPRKKGAIQKADITERDSNPSCGDVVVMHLKLKGNKIAKASFEGSGCAISQASASMLAEKIEGMVLEGVAALSSKDVLEMLGIPLQGQRLKCALLSLHVAKKALSKKIANVKDDFYELDA